MVDAGAVDELLELVDGADVPTGELQPRSLCHATGLRHRTVYVLLTRGGEVLLQQRASTKAVCPGCWDVTVAEHLQPGEGYADAARRGLREELGLSPPALRQRLPPSPRTLHYRSPAKALVDAELVALFQAEWPGEPSDCSLDAAEVAQVAWLPLAELAARTQAQPGAFTPWLLHTLRLLGVTGTPAACAGVWGSAEVLAE